MLKSALKRRRENVFVGLLSTDCMLPVNPVANVLIYE